MPIYVPPNQSQGACAVRGPIPILKRLIFTSLQANLLIPLDPTLAKQLEVVLHDLENLIRDDLAPQFVAARMDPESGAILAPEWEGEPLSASYQAAVARSGAALEQHGLVEDDARRLATRAVDFIVRNLWDDDHGGWFERAGEAEAGEKSTITQARVLAAMADFLMVSGDFEVAERVVETFKIVQVFAADNLHGGYGGRFTRDWRVLDPEDTVDHAVALAEAFSVAYQALGTDVYQRRAAEAIQRLLAERQTAIHPNVLRSLSLLDAPADIADGYFSRLSADRFANVNETDNTLICLELWGHTRDVAWLARALDFAGADEEPAQYTLPNTLRKETLLLKALYGANQ